jgi:hypothetical protein
MKKFIIGIAVLALMALLMSNVYAGQHRHVKQVQYVVPVQPVQYVPVRYVNEPVKTRNVTWTWTYSAPYAVTPAVVYEPVPLVVYAPPVRRCPRPPCPFELLDRLLFGN